MKEREYKARDKVVQKMTRDGLTERNLAEGTEQGISQRPADYSFRQTDSGDSDVGAGRQRESCAGRGNRRAYPRQTNGTEDYGMPIALQKQEERGVAHTAVGGMPSFPAQEMEVEPDNRDVARRSYIRQDAQQGSVNPHQQKEEGFQNVLGSRGIDSDTMWPDVGSRDSDAEGRMLDTGVGQSHTGHVSGKQMNSRDKRLQFRAAERNEGEASTQGNENASAPHEGQESYASDAEADVWQTEAETGKQLDNRSYGQRDRRQESPGREPRRMGRQMKKKVQRTGAGAWREQHRMAYGQDKTEDGNPKRVGQGTDTGIYRQEEHLPAAGRGLEDAVARKRVSYELGPEAEANPPIRYRLKLESQEDGSSGRRKSRLRFEAGTVPENQKPSLLKRTGGGLVQAAQSAVSSKTHQKVREAEQDNVGVESVHKAEAAVERAGGRAYRISRERLRTRSYRAARRAEKQAISAEGNAAYRKFLTEKPEMQKKTLAKWVQKQKIKRKYAAAAREAAKGAGHAVGTFVSTTGKAASRMTQYLKAGKGILVIVVGTVLLLAVSGSLFTSCSSMSMGMGAAVASACYLAEETEIDQCELRYTELETDLQLDIANTERDYPGYDEYRYNIGEIGHNPYELMGYLSAVFDDFTYVQVEAELYRLFNLQYRLTREIVTETRTYLDEEGEEQEYEWRIFKTVLLVRPLSGILSASLGAGDSAERYGIYMQTYGGRQQFGSPFGFPWLGYVTSPYGYRVHPLYGGKDLHRGVDIAVAVGTPILAVQDGRVVSAGEAGGYGLCLVIEGEDGYQSRYAHCSSLAFRAGEEVRQGEVVAYVGNTGDSTGTHLHLEVIHNGEYLDPYFFVDNGGGGYTAAGNAAGSPQFSADAGEPMGDGTFGAMLEVAERYMGYPYVWGGSSPSTSFDCSGYVSYVINQSGAGSVGRQTAQGLCNLCTPVSWEDLQPGDLVFFTGTYSSPTPVSHVGIYVGGGRMAHAGDPIGYADIGGSQYWKGHFYCGGRLP